MLTITSFGEGKCVWCCQVTEGAQAKFQDGLSGFFCKKHFWQALQVRSLPQDKQASTESAKTCRTQSRVLSVTQFLNPDLHKIGNTHHTDPGVRC